MKRSMDRRRYGAAAVAALAGAIGIAAFSSCNQLSGPGTSDSLDPALVAQGKTIFRHDTYGDETFWTDTLRMTEPIGTAVSPKTALSVGLKVDMDTLPASLVAAMRCRDCYRRERWRNLYNADHGGCAMIRPRV